MTAPIWIVLGAVALLLFWSALSRKKTVDCELDLESTHEHLHALLELEGFDPEPGDGVRMLNPPQQVRDVPLGEKSVTRSKAVVRRASWPKRLWFKITGGVEIRELFEVGFE